MSLVTLRDAIVAELESAVRSVVPSLKTCEAHGGRFDAEEVKRVSASAPAVFIACLDIADTEEQMDEVEGTITWGAFIVTRSTAGAKRDSVALAIVDALLVHIGGARLSVEGEVQRPNAVRARNLYGAKVDKMGVALWAVSWRHRMNIGEPLDPTELDDLITVDVRYDLDTDNSGEPVANDHITNLDQKTAEHT